MHVERAAQILQLHERSRALAAQIIRGLASLGLNERHARPFENLLLTLCRPVAGAIEQCIDENG